MVGRYTSLRMRYGSDCIRVTGPLGLLCWSLALTVVIRLLKEEYGADLAMGVCA